jgi:GMP reductase
MKTFELVEIDDIEYHPEYDGKVYDLTVEDDHSYNIEGVVVHNSVCTTRIKTGVGYPQLSAVIECADAAHGLGGHIIADGGCSNPGDVSKAFGAGADFVMLGGMLSGTDQGGGEVVDGKVEFYGMSSTESQRRNSNVKDYRASEGRVVRVGYKGSVEPIVRDILGGLRSSCTYVGASALKELPKRTTFVRIASGDTHNRIYESTTVGE